MSGKYLAAGANAGRRASIELAKGGVEPTHAAKAGAIGNLGQRFIRLVNQALRPLYTSGFCDLLRTGPDVPFEQARKVSRAYAEPSCQCSNRTAIQRAAIERRAVKGLGPKCHWLTMTFLAALRHDRVTAPWLIMGRSMAKPSKSTSRRF
jgi:hypothetical protein